MASTDSSAKRLPTEVVLKILSYYIAFNIKQSNVLYEANMLRLATSSSTLLDHFRKRLSHEASESERAYDTISQSCPQAYNTGCPITIAGSDARHVLQEMHSALKTKKCLDRLHRLLSVSIEKLASL